MMNTCCICLAGFCGNRRKIFVTDCKHLFHLSCIKKLRDKRCPCCRTPIRIPPAGIHIRVPIVASLPTRDFAVAVAVAAVPIQQGRVVAPYSWIAYLGVVILKIIETLCFTFIINLCVLMYWALPYTQLHLPYYLFVLLTVVAIMGQSDYVKVN